MVKEILIREHWKISDSFLKKMVPSGRTALHNEIVREAP
jgi:hypothetical protein